MYFANLFRLPTHNSKAQSCSLPTPKIMADHLLSAAIDGDFTEVNKLLAETKDSGAIVHALIGAISNGHKEVVTTIMRRKDFNISLFNNAALKWALSKQNNEVVDAITAHPSFSFGTHIGILMAAVKANNANAARLALHCPTMTFTKEFMNDCVKQAVKRDLHDVLSVLVEDPRCAIETNILRYILEDDSVTDEARTKLYRAILNNPSYNPRARELVDVAFHEKATPEMRRMAYLQDPENGEDCMAGKLVEVDDFALFKLNCGSDAFDSLSATVAQKKYKWIEYMVNNDKIPEAVLNDFDAGEDEELTKILTLV